MGSSVGAITDYPKSPLTAAMLHGSIGSSQPEDVFPGSMMRPFKHFTSDAPASWSCAAQVPGRLAQRPLSGRTTE